MRTFKKILSAALVFIMLLPSVAQAMDIVKALENMRKQNNGVTIGSGLDGNLFTFQISTLKDHVKLVDEDVWGNETGGAGQWEKTSNNRMKFRCKVYNHHSSKTIKAFELYIYATNVWGERLYGETSVYYGTTTREIKPGGNAYSDYLVIPQRNSIDQVYVGVKRVVYTDGTQETTEDVDYRYWTIKW